MYPPLLKPTTEWRAGAPESFPERLEYLRQRPFTPIGGWLGLLSPEWPDRPYLSIEADERTSRIEQFERIMQLCQHRLLRPFCGILSFP